MHHAVPSSRLCLLQIDAPEKKRQLFMTEHYLLHRAVRIGPPKTALVQFLRAYPKPASVIHNELQAVASRIREQENVAALRSAAQMIAHQTVEPIEMLAHFRRAMTKSPRMLNRELVLKILLAPVKSSFLGFS